MKKLLILTVGIFVFTTLMAKEPGDTSIQNLLNQISQLDSIEKTLNYKTGKIPLGAGIATIDVPANFKFLGSEQAKYVIEELWGNPPMNEAPLGLLMPANTDATAYGSYAFVVTYNGMGYVKDEDADKINYNDLLKDLRKESEEENKERTKLGISTMDLIGWASKPYYDKEKNVLHWAKEYSVPGAEEHTLNYDIRLLGRKGVLILQAVSDMSELDSVKSHIGDVLGMVSFTEGNKYSDFNASTDEVAAWTIGGLVAGKVLAKVGFFAVIAKFFKFIVAGIVLAGGAIWRFIKGRKAKREELAYEPQVSSSENKSE